MADDITDYLLSVHGPIKAVVEWTYPGGMVLRSNSMEAKEGETLELIRTKEKGNG